MPVGADMQCIGNTEMIPEKLMESGVQKIQGTPMNFEKFIAFLKKRI